MLIIIKSCTFSKNFVQNIMGKFRSILFSPYWQNFLVSLCQILINMENNRIWVEIFPPKIWMSKTYISKPWSAYDNLFFYLFFTIYPGKLQIKNNYNFEISTIQSITVRVLYQISINVENIRFSHICPKLYKW